MNAIQVLWECGSFDAALQGAREFGEQFGCVASRVIGDGRRKPYAAQAFFPMDAVQVGHPLPEGCRLVLLPSSIPLACQIA